MPKYKVKKDAHINIQTGSRKAGNKKTVSYKGGDSVELTAEQAASHAADIEAPKETEKK